MRLLHQVALFICLVECLLFGGTLYGWPSLVYVLKHDGIYSHLCRPLKNKSQVKEQHLHQQQQQQQQQQNLSAGLKCNATECPPSVPISRSNASIASRAPGRNSSIDDSWSPDHKKIRSHIPPEALASCGAQETHLALAVILAVLAQGLTALPMGRLFDKVGLRFTRTLGSVFGFTGYSILAFVQGSSSWLVYLGCVLIGLAQNIVMMTNCYLAELAGNRASTVVAVYNGAMLASSGVLLAVKIGHDHGLPRTTGLTILSGLWILTVLNTFTLLPKRKILRPAQSSTSPPQPGDSDVGATPYVASDQQDLRTEDDGTGTTDNGFTSSYVPAYEISWTRGLLASDEQEYEMAEIRDGEIRSDVNKPQEDGRSWIAHAKSSLFVTFVYWFCSLHFRINVFISTFSLWVTVVVDGDPDKESYFTDVYGYVNIAGVLLSPIPGLLIDYRRKKLAVNERFGLLGAMATVPILTFATSLALLMGLTSLLMYESAIFLSISLCVVLRAFVYPTGTSFIGLMWPSRVYGSLYGATFALLGAAAFLQYPFVIWASSIHRGNLSMNALLLLLTLLSFLFPGNILFKYRKRKEQDQTSVAS